MYDKYLKEMDNIKLYQKKEVNKLDDEFNIIFRYELKDAIGMLKKGLFITNDNGNNVCLYASYEGKEELHIDTTEIINILNKYVDKLQPMDKLPFSNVLDGYINEINFKINNKWYNFNYSNLFAYDRETINNNENLTNIFGFLNELYNYFDSKDKTINDYFVLCLESEIEEEI